MLTTRHEAEDKAYGCDVGQKKSDILPSEIVHYFHMEPVLVLLEHRVVQSEIALVLRSYTAPNNPPLLKKFECAMRAYEPSDTGNGDYGSFHTSHEATTEIQVIFDQWL